MTFTRTQLITIKSALIDHQGRITEHMIAEMKKNDYRMASVASEAWEAVHALIVEIERELTEL